MNIKPAQTHPVQRHLGQSHVRMRKNNAHPISQAIVHMLEPIEYDVLLQVVSANLMKAEAYVLICNVCREARTRNPFRLNIRPQPIADSTFHALPIANLYSAKKLAKPSITSHLDHGWRTLQKPTIWPPDDPTVDVL